jgi:hypothetical protein
MPTEPYVSFKKNSRGFPSFVPTPTSDIATILDLSLQNRISHRCRLLNDPISIFYSHHLLLKIYFECNGLCILNYKNKKDIDTEYRCENSCHQALNVSFDDRSIHPGKDSKFCSHRYRLVSLLKGL